MRFFIKSYGCQMNSYDSQRMSDMLAGVGYELVPSPEDANVVVLNTCSIRDKADEKVFSDLGRLKSIKDKSSEDFLIVVAGCMAQLRSQDIIKRAPYVDIILGPQNIQQIAAIVDDFIKNKALDTVVSTSMDANSKFNQLFGKFSNRSVSEFLTIQEGCDNFCTYCVVPYTRGREFSRSVADIINETKNLISLGVREITLLGQNVNSYNGEDLGGKSCNLSGLLFRLADIDGLKRLRYTTSNPKDVDCSIAEAHRDIDILMPSLHLPVQSGSDAILRKMNRKYTQGEYLRCIDMLRSYRPDIAFSSDFIVGFPGETDEDFEETLELVKKVNYAQAYSFKYSPRPGTAAAKMNDQISDDVKSERLQILQDLLNDQQSQFNENFIGRCLKVLFVKNGKHENQLVGRSEYSHAVSVSADNVSIGDIASVRITSVASHSLIGTIER
ncbi:MAG: tRNA (N6-isopentenyl adenosine(37)-C2)-methylthiotransferase MiaB [Holosporaceae bacterium]|jgi:tRNA-2-methylthio-N6-dimethylallyladenosine synthase|nr:tRNA (N6-isopentenyl adenosine(37)-C2)-methylthiotransferase MiaB [Holosporaceae bacterium]